MKNPMDLKELENNKLFNCLDKESQERFRGSILKRTITNNLVDKQYIKKIFADNQFYFKYSIFSCMSCRHAYKCREERMEYDCTNLGKVVVWLTREPRKRSSLDQLI